MSSAKRDAETDLARFFRLFHDAYPTSLSKKRRNEIGAIAFKVLSREITWEEGLDLAHIPREVSDSDVAAHDEAYKYFVWILMLLFVSAAFGSFPESKQERGPNIDPKDQGRILDAFRSTFDAPKDEPEELVPIPGKPVPVFGLPEPTKKPRRRRPGSRKGSRSETGGGPTRKRAAKAKSHGKKKKP